MSVMDRQWLEERVTKTKALIVAYEDAMIALAGGAQSYTLDTGQTRQTVTKADVGSMRLMLDALESRLAWLEMRLCGASIRVTPGW
jgi:hypothetical protein